MNVELMKCASHDGTQQNRGAEDELSGREPQAGGRRQSHSELFTWRKSGTILRQNKNARWPRDNK